MRNDRHLAEALRRKGYSYNAIVQELGVAKSTLSEWLANTSWSREIHARLDQRNRILSTKRMRALAYVQKAKWEAWREGFRVEARRRFSSLIKNPLFVAGLMLYWGEGDGKSISMVRITNTSHKMLKLFVSFLIVCCRIPRTRIRVYLILYPDLTAEKERRFWSRQLGIPVNQFGRDQVIKSRTSNGLHPSKRLEHGICMVHVNSRGLKEQMRVWQDLCYQHVAMQVLRA